MPSVGALDRHHGGDVRRVLLVVLADLPEPSKDAVTVALVAAASPAFFNLVAHGQNSALALLCFTGMFFALKHERHFVAGLALGSLIFKPQLGLVAGCVFILSGQWWVVWRRVGRRGDSTGAPVAVFRERGHAGIRRLAAGCG